MTADPQLAGEGIFAAALGVSWANSALHVLWSDRPLYVWSARAWAARQRWARVAVLLACTTVFATTVAAWLTSDFPRASAVLVLLCLVGVRQWEKREWAGDTVVRLGKYVPTAACLLAWGIADTVAQAVGVQETAASAMGWEAACGVLAAIYFLAALSKLQKTGWRWMVPAHQALLIVERAYSGPRIVRRIRRWGATNRRMCTFVGTFGLLSEIACLLYVVPLARIPITATVLSLHAGIMLFLGYVEPEWWLLMIALTVLTG